MTKIIHIGKNAIKKYICSKTTTSSTVYYKILSATAHSSDTSISFYVINSCLKDLNLPTCSVYYLVHSVEFDNWAFGNSLSDTLSKLYSQQKISYIVNKHCTSYSAKNANKYHARITFINSIKEHGKKSSRSDSVIEKQFNCKIFPIYIESDTIAATIAKDTFIEAQKIVIDTNSSDYDIAISSYISNLKHNDLSKEQTHQEYVEQKYKKLKAETVPLKEEKSSAKLENNSYFEAIKDLLEEEIERRAKIRAIEIFSEMFNDYILNK